MRRVRSAREPSSWCKTPAYGHASRLVVRPASTRRGGGDCEPCPDYQVCVDGSLVTQQWCHAGNPPNDAVEFQYQDCVAGSTQTLTACVNPGDTAPSDFVCPPQPTCAGTETAHWDDTIGTDGDWVCNPLSCPAGERPVAGDCEPCPDYQVCSNGSLATQQWCSAGDPPADAYEVQYQACVGGSLTTLTACLNPGGDPPDNAYEVSVQYCDAGTTLTQTVCVNAGDSPPPDAPCSSCPSGERLVGVNCEPCPDYQVCSGGSLATQQWCSAGDPPDDAYEVQYQACVGGSLTTLTACLNPGGDPPDNAYEVTVQYCDAGTTLPQTVCVNAGDSPPPDAPCPVPPACACGTAEWENGGWQCPSTTAYAYCDGNNLATGQWCEPDAGPVPPNSTTNTYQVCNNGALTPQTECLDSGEQATADDTLGEEIYCSDGSSATRNICGADTDTRSATEQYCSGGVSSSRTINGTCTDTDTRSATRTYCDSNGNAQTETIAACADEDDRPISCPPGEELNGDGCCWQPPEPPECVQPARPPCSPDGQSWNWNEADCQWDSESVSMPPCSQTIWNNGALWLYVYSDCSASYWSELSCSWIMIYAGTQTAVPLQ